MDHCKRFFSGALLALVLLSGQPVVQAAGDECDCDLPSPFGPAPYQTENRWSKWRHGFHTWRMTWDKYFEVYPKELADSETVTLEKLQANPTFYMDRKIQFDIYFSKTGNFYRPYTTQFIPDIYANFHGWPYGADLWIKEVRTAAHLMFYVDRKRDKETEALAHIPAYTPLHVWGEVKSRSEGFAWIEIKHVEVIPETVLNDATLRHLELAYIQMKKKNFELATDALEEALRQEMPVIADTRAYAMLGRA